MGSGGSLAVPDMMHFTIEEKAKVMDVLRRKYDENVATKVSSDLNAVNAQSSEALEKSLIE